MVVRDAGWVDREYNREKWSELLDLAESLVADGERSMPRLLSLLELHQRNSWNRATTDSSPHASAAFAQLVNVPFTAAFEGFAGMVARTICNACRPETGCVVELGSGYGRFLFRVWLCGGPADAPYFAMEFTEAGRQCTRAIADLEPAIDMRVSPFDYNDPDYSVLPSGLGHAVVFSCQSIEQMPALKKEVLTGLFGVAREITCLHFEPVGWQLNEKDKTTWRGRLKQGLCGRKRLQPQSLAVADGTPGRKPNQNRQGRGGHLRRGAGELRFNHWLDENRLTSTRRPGAGFPRDLVFVENVGLYLTMGGGKNGCNTN